jgi:hypothetical protein
MKVTNRIQDVWDTGTRQAQSQRKPSDSEQAGGWTGWVERQFAQRPTLTLGLGLALGVTIGWLIKRR